MPELAATHICHLICIPSRWKGSAYLTGTHDLLVVIDQHAAHERVRLEAFTAGNKLINFYLSADTISPCILLLLYYTDLWENSTPSTDNLPTSATLPPTSNLRIKSSHVHPPIAISLQPSERRLAKLFRKQLESIGQYIQTQYIYSLPRESMRLHCFMNYMLLLWYHFCSGTVVADQFTLYAFSYICQHFSDGTLQLCFGGVWQHWWTICPCFQWLQQCK